MMIGAARIQTTHMNLIIMSPKAVHCKDKGDKGPGGTACGHQDTHVTFDLNWNPLDLMPESNLGPF